MQLEKEATCVAEHGAQLIAPPQRGGGCAAILANGLQLGALLISQGRRHGRESVDIEEKYKDQQVRKGVSTAGAGKQIVESDMGSE